MPHALFDRLPPPDELHEAPPAPTVGALATGWVAMSAPAARWCLHHLPPPLDRLAWRVLHRLHARHGVRLEATATWGGRFRCDLRDLVDSRIYYAGVWEPSVTALLTQLLRPGDVFIDIGANIGYDSVLAARLVGPSGRVVAIEPSPSLLGRLREHLALNDVRNARVLAAAVTAVPCDVALYLGPPTNRAATSIIPRSGHALEATVPGRPLAVLVHPAELARARVIKLDVEGAEAPILRQLLTLLPRLPRDVEIVAEVTPSRFPEFGEDAETIFAAFRAAGFGWALLHNVYDASTLRAPEIHPPVPVSTVPDESCDLVLARRFAPP
ncbi:MAG: FkbM family methyltransferase [Gemmatimonadales bacterium]|nr:FkbM family methyltransferase [Gemmatimonadales bacterium]